MAVATLTQRRVQSGRVLLALRFAWLVIAGLAIGQYLISVYLHARLMFDYPNIAFSVPRWTPEELKLALANMGLPIGWFVAYQVLPSLIFAIISCALGALIFRRAADTWFEFYVSLLFVLIATGAHWGTVATMYPQWWLPLALFNFMALPALGCLPYVFPDGRFVPRATRWLAPLWFTVIFVSWLLLGWFPFGRFDLSRPEWHVVGLTLFAFFGFVVLLLSICAAQIYRYVRVADATQRLQAKWFMFAITVLVVVMFLFGVLVPLLYPDVLRPTMEGLQYALVGTGISFLVRLLIPLSITFAILRYRLWDIDLLINRTLVYVPLTAILAGLFSVSSDVAKKSLLGLIGNSADAIATLLIVALFDPLKGAIQHFVDKYLKEAPDPTKQLRAYSESINAIVQILEPRECLGRLLQESLAAFGAVGGAVYLGSPAAPTWFKSTAGWNGQAQLELAFQDEGRPIGWLKLGARRNGQPYTAQDRQVLEQNLSAVTRVLKLARQEINVNRVL